MDLRQSFGLPRSLELILVTGAAGYIGSHVIIDLVERGEECVGLDNFSNAKRINCDRIARLTSGKVEIVDVDLLDNKSLTDLFTKFRFSSVIHFGALKSVEVSVQRPMRYYENNVVGLMNLLSVMRNAGTEQLLFSSSATVYDPHFPSPFSETAALKPNNPYGRTKLIGEMLIRDFSASNSNFVAAILRYFNPVGAHHSGLIGEDPIGIPSNLMPYLLQVASGDIPELKIFGDDWPTKDGFAVRDYIHISDLVDGHYAALLSLRKKVEKILTLNLGTGTGTSVMELVTTFKHVTGLEVPCSIVGRRAGDVAVSLANPTLAKELLGWSAKRNLEEMCWDSWCWAKEMMLARIK
jgi:UDP-glucose 4-epimerase